MLAGTLGTVFCGGCGIGKTAEGDAYFTAHYSEISVVPLPADFPMMAGGLALLGYLGWGRKGANPRFQKTITRKKLLKLP